LLSYSRSQRDFLRALGDGFRRRADSVPRAPAGLVPNVDAPKETAPVLVLRIRQIEPIGSNRKRLIGYIKFN
jgi:hypothetical protein